MRALPKVPLRPTEPIETIRPEGQAANHRPLEAEFACDWQSLIAAAP